MADNELKVRFTGDTKGLDKATKKAEKDLKGFGKTASTLGKSLAGVFAVGAIVNFTKESIKLAATIEGVERRFKQLNGVNLNDLQRATRGTVDNLSLMKAAVQARNFKIPLENLGKFFQFATQRAVETGDSVDHLVSSIILGVGRKSPLILDNLGISAVELRKKLKGVGTESASVADISKAMSDIIDEAAEEFGGLGKGALTSGQNLQTFASAITNAQAEIGKALLELEKETGVIQGFTDLLSTRVQRNQAVEELEALGVQGKEINKIFETSRRLDESREQTLDRLNARLVTARKNAKAFDEAVQEGLDIGKKKVSAQKVEIQLTDEQKKVLEKLDLSLRKVSASQGILGTDFNRTEERISLYQQALINLIAMGVDPASSKIKELNKQLRIQQGLLKEVPDALTGEGLAQPNLPKSAAPTVSGGATFAGSISDAEYAQKKAVDMKMAFQEAAQAVGLSVQGIANEFSNLFNGMLQEGNLTFTGLLVGLGRLLTKLVAALAISAALRSSMGDPTAAAKSIATITAVSTVVGGLLSSIPQLAEGGVTNGPTLAMIGEGKEQEAVLPLSKLAGLMSGGFGINSRQSSVSTNSSAMSRVSSNNSSNSSAMLGNVKFRLEGNDLVGSIQRTFKNNGSSGGAVSFG